MFGQEVVIVTDLVQKPLDTGVVSSQDARVSHEVVVVSSYRYFKV